MSSPANRRTKRHIEWQLTSMDLRARADFLTDLLLEIIPLLPESDWKKIFVVMDESHRLRAKL